MSIARITRCGVGLLALASFWIVAVADGGAARADAVAYLVNVTVRPGYGFTSPDDALSYGRGICEKVRGGQTYGRLVADVMDDFNTSDWYQGSYLVNQAVNELCPTFIWQLRNAAVEPNPSRQ
jgi:hypothetical protein